MPSERCDQSSSLPTVTSLERDFPIGPVSRVAEKESWRKEIHRPATHTHKWWAQRLGSVFRAILCGAITSTRAEAEKAIASSTRAPDLVVYDPFAGSGTTLAEAVRLGARVIAWDINPVATLVQRQSVGAWDRARLDAAYKEVLDRSRDEILRLHRTDDGRDVLYYFWVAQAACPACHGSVDLFSSYVFARHAYAAKHPEAKATCRSCHEVIPVNLADDEHATCPRCGDSFSLVGPVRGPWMTCSCGSRSRVVDALGGTKPTFKMFAKLVQAGARERSYELIDDFDLALYEEAASLGSAHPDVPAPEGDLDDGYNTRQALRWGFSSWRDFFNARQLYSLGLLARAVSDLEPHDHEREALIALFSGVLEFNNLFCSYKGEGTGAVRHMFSHHVLKPERTPLEANPWGTPLSSGAFSTLFGRRILRALEYKDRPHDLCLVDGEPVRTFDLGEALSVPIASTYEEFRAQDGAAYVRCGNSAQTDLPDRSVDLVVTDPPFMDNVHYSELADFFHAWLKQLHPYSDYGNAPSTRQLGEVQSQDPQVFGDAIGLVWLEVARVLRDAGLLAFTFHQARRPGWAQLMNALANADFVVTSIQPVKAEMSSGAPKSGAATPSNLDSIVVCRKAIRSPAPFAASPADAVSTARERLTELESTGTRVGEADIASVLTGSVLSLLTSPARAGFDLGELGEFLDTVLVESG